MSPRNFERPALVSLPEDPTLAPGSALEGLWLPARGEEGARGGAVVAAPHPLMGGSMESPNRNSHSVRWSSNSES